MSVLWYKYNICMSKVYNSVNSTSNGVQVGGLRPYTLYQFKVRTHDHYNKHSEYSQKVECQTLEDGEFIYIILFNFLETKVIRFLNVQFSNLCPSIDVQKLTLSWHTHKIVYKMFNFEWNWETKWTKVKSVSDLSIQIMFTLINN